MTSVSLDPPTLLACMNKTSVAGHAIAIDVYFVVNILPDEHAQVATHLAEKASAFDGHAV